MRFRRSTVLIGLALLLFILPARVILVGDTWDWIEIISGVVGLICVYLAVFFLDHQNGLKQ